ncbi:ribosome small subunit-dependent GTPase A [Planosporangium mesophilum]|uniref:Small ribosomal subunit biogenesis GTPase RsgA n=1 Tax=Planosporangium mesophilum TaxID=689768 RepID=A0A8J3T7I8_9ACTN|nr:ribosome small subunit-dependent GTPase A [Planosporangium mesophilum]NJC83311.1 ribosome small subunit-dependent GTPase A [Planosporangium mesophilum]GII21688.1 putative ribosome biogenesis GTPase RsgA [Planosporangium mesophilum]
MTFDLRSLGWDPYFAGAYAAYDRRGRRPARVLRVDRGVCTVLGDSGAARASLAGSILAAAAADPVVLPCAGDWVVVHTWPDRRLTVESVLPRRTAVVRASAGAASHAQVLAANLDVAAVVEPLDPEPDPGRMERLLALAYSSGARPIVIATKADLVPRPDDVVAQLAAVAPGVPVHAVSARTGDGVAQLRSYLPEGGTLGLLGPSGAGKSSLVNALAGTTVLTTQALRADGRGRHTTTFRTLIPLPGGGVVIDTPGIRAVGMIGGDSVPGSGLGGGFGLDRAFADVAALAARCRFGDCRHDAEPDCGVRAAIEVGELAPRRLASWRKLMREQSAESRRRQDRLAAEAGASWAWVPKQERRGRARP